MRISRTVAIGLVAWLAVVAVGSTLVWAVISRVGDDVTSSASPAATGTAGQSATPRPTGATGPDPSADTDPQDPDPGTRRTWQGVGGSLVAQCRGDAVSLVSAQPDAGYAVEVEDEGPGVVAVEFEGREDDEGRKVKVEAVCVDGAPEFSVETDED